MTPRRAPHRTPRPGAPPAAGAPPRLPRARLAVYAGVYVAVAAALHLAIGTDLPHTLAALAAALAVTVLVLGQPEPRSPRWPRTEVTDKHGARDDVTSLSWLLTSRDETVTPRAVRAVRAAAARALLGDETFDFVESRLPRPTVHHLGRAVDRLTELDPTRSTP